jgi:hypothetical protein
LIEYQIDGQKYYFIELDVQTSGQGGASVSISQKQWFDLNGEMVFSFDYEFGDEKKSESSTFLIKDDYVVVSVFDENKKFKKIKEMK